MLLGPVMVDLEGFEITPKEYALLRHPRVGGIILFSRNYKNKEQLKDLCKEIRNIAGRALLIAVDHEGGKIWRFKEGFTKLPPSKDFGTLYQSDANKAIKSAKDAGKTMASELLECGVDLSLAPVLDMDYGMSDVIGDRSYHSDPNIVTSLAKAFIEGMNAAGMKATGKHFPGHGGCKEDSHIAQAVDDRPLDEMMKSDLIPFKNLSEYLGAIMPAHVIYPKIDSVPAGFSNSWLQGVLRKQLQFKGAIISDCLSMKAAAIESDFVVRAQMALDAGCDMVILCQQEREFVSFILENLGRDMKSESSKRLENLKGTIV